MKAFLRALRKILSDSLIELFLILLYMDNGRLWMRPVKWG